jgi:hypothetical protein
MNEIQGVGLVRWTREKTVGDIPRGYGVKVLEFHDNSEKQYYEYLESCLVSLKVADLMRKRYFTVFPDTSMKSAVAIMNRENTDVLIVTNSVDRPVGLLTSHEILLAVQNDTFWGEPVNQFMNRGPFCVSPNQSFESTYEMIRNKMEDYLPVVEDDTLVGLLSVRDLLPYWAESQELQARRLQETVEKAVSVMAHDLRSQIGVVRTSNALLTSGELSGKDYVDSGLPEVVESNCDFVLDLVDGILDIEQIKVGVVRLDLKLIDLEDVIDKVARCFNPTAQSKKIHVEVDIPTAVPKIKADARRIEQVLNNLVSNAVKYCEEGGQVVVGLKAHHSQVAVWVADNGPGIPEHEVHKLFREFSPISVRPTRGEKSHGLGLAIAKKLIEAHGGSIRVDSDPGEGSTFTFFLPIGVIQ